MATKKQSVKVAKKVGKPSAWDKTIKPRLAEIEQWRADGATINQIAKHLGLNPATLYETQNKYPEFSESLARAKAGREEALTGEVWSIAFGERYETGKEFTDENGVKKWERHPAQPQLPALLAILKQHHGWSDNPVRDNAEAKALNDAQLRAAFCARLGLASYCNTPAQVQVPAKPDKPDANRPA